MPSRKVRGLLPRSYVAVWAVLALISGVYLAVLAVKPALVETAYAPGARNQPVIIGPLGSNEAQALERALMALHGEIGALRSALAERDERERALLSRLVQVEARQSGQGEPALTTSSVRPPTDGSARDGTTGLSGQRVEGQVREGGDAPTQAITPVAFGPAKVEAAQPASGPLAIQIATGPSADAMRVSWMALSERHRPILKELSARIVQSSSGSGPAYRLVAGPVPNQAAANRLCSQLRARRVTCGIAPFEGEPF